MRHVVATVILSIISLFFIAPATVSAQDGSEGRDTAIQTQECEFPDTSLLGIPLWYKYLDGRREVVIYQGQPQNADTAECQPVIDDIDDALPIGLAALEIMLTLAGMVAVVMVLWGSFNFVLSQGESDKAASARKTVINAAIGLAIIIVATRVVTFIANALTN